MIGKKTGCLVACTAALLLLGIFGVIKTQAAETIDSGTCGESLTWTLDSEGLLSIQGYGEMTESPWREHHMFEISKVVISEDVQNIVHEAFEDCKYLTSISIPGSVQEIGYKAVRAIPKSPNL